MPLPVLLAASGVTLLVTLRLSAVLRNLWRLRWMLLAIVLLYAAFTPGDPWSASLPGLSREGLVEGLRRGFVLITLLQLVDALLAQVSVPQLCAGLELILRPFQVLGLPSSVFARRLGLTLGGVAQAQAHLDQARLGQARLSFDAAARLVCTIENAAVAADSNLQQQVLPLPPLWQWLLPPALLIAGMVLAR